MYGETLITAAATEPLTMTEVKTHLGLPSANNDFDAQLSALIETARRFFEEWTNRQIVSATWDFTFDAFPVGRQPLLVPRSPIQSITSVTYTDADGNSTTWSSSNYTVDVAFEPGRVFPVFNGVWPVARGIEGALVVRAVCGYGTAAQVPASVKACLLMLVDDWFNERDGSGKVGPTAERLIGIHKVGDEWLAYGRDN